MQTNGFNQKINYSPYSSTSTSATQRGCCKRTYFAPDGSVKTKKMATGNFGKNNNKMATSGGGGSGTGLQVAGLVLQGISIILNAVIGFKQLALQDKIGRANTLTANNNYLMAMDAYRRKANQRALQNNYNIQKVHTLEQSAAANDYYNRGDVVLDRFGNKSKSQIITGGTFNWDTGKEEKLKDNGINEQDRQALVQNIITHDGDTPTNNLPNDIKPVNLRLASNTTQQSVSSAFYNKPQQQQTQLSTPSSFANQQQQQQINNTTVEKQGAVVAKKTKPTKPQTSAEQEQQKEKKKKKEKQIEQKGATDAIV